MSAVRDKDAKHKETNTLLAAVKKGVRSTGPGAVVVRVPRTIRGLKTHITVAIPLAPGQHADDRTIALGLVDKGFTSREAAETVGTRPGTVRRWTSERVAITPSAAPTPLTRGAVDRLAYVAERPAPDGSGLLTKNDREELASLFGDERRVGPERPGQRTLVASLLDDIDWDLLYSKDKERKQTREPGKNARGPNRQARDELRARASWIHDVGYVGKERDRRSFKAEFIDIVLRAAGYPAPMLKRGEMPTPNESWAVHETPARSCTAIELGRALGQPSAGSLENAIYDAIKRGAAQAYPVELKGKQAPEALDRREEIKLDILPLGEARRRARKTKWGEGVLRWEESLRLERAPDHRAISRFTAEHDDGRALYALYHEHRLTPIDAVRKDAVLNERCRRLGVSLEERRVTTR